jgi:undecaprenol kinase
MKRLFKSFAYASAGIVAAIKSERNFRIHIVAMVIVIGLGIYVQLSVQAWGFLIFAIGFVLAAELFNTALERLGDEITNGEHKQMVKKAKDIAAAAVLISALTALVIGIVFLFVPLVQKLMEL